MLRDADELRDAQYAHHPELRTIANALLAWAETEGVEVQLRKGYVSLHSARRKFTQITRAKNSCVDVALRIDAPAQGRLEAVRVREENFFARRSRLRDEAAIDDEVLAYLARALHQNG